MLSDRVTTLREAALSSRQLGDPQAGAIRAESLAETEGLPAVLREAHAYAHYCRRQELVVGDGELLVGGRPGLTRNPTGRVTPAVFGRRDFGNANAIFDCPDQVAPYFRAGMLSWAGNHKTMDFARVFAVGFNGLLQQIDFRLTRGDAPDAAQRDFLAALRIVAEGYLELCSRYADRAAALAEAEPDPARRAELERIAGHCFSVPAEPPTTFWEACQCAWSCFLFVPDAPGRVDQYLGRFYDRDIAAGSLTREFAKELLGCLWIKYFEVVGAASGVSAINHLTLGGTLPDGSDGSNEVTRLCLEVVAETCLLRPQVGLRWHRGTPPEVLRCAVETLRAGSGNPDFCNDEQIVPALTRLGVGAEDARDFSLSGCHEVIVTGKAQMGSVEGFINLPKVLRMSLGLEPELEQPDGLDGVAGAEAFYQRVLGSLARVAEMAHLASLGRDRQAAEVPGGELTVSLVTQDCIDNCRGYTQGGARYNFCNWDVIGLANLADSLSALNQLVFEDAALSLAELAAVLAADWEGHEPLRQRVLNRTARFGNDDSTVDSLAARLLEDLERLFQGWTPFRGGRYILGTTAGGENMHIEYGRATGATPDGRHAGEPLADSVGAAQGRDRRGVTALLTSVAALPHRLLPTATTLNVKLDPRVLDTDDGVAKVAALIEGHFRAGGQQLQFSLVDRALLLEAKREPEKHRDLMVRVAGYSAPFCSLWEDLQDEIIARTEHCV